MVDRQQLEAAIAAQEGLRGVVPDEIVDAALTALRQQLAGLDGLDGRRRQVTVLFADVSGFTAMSETLDAELLAERMNDLWDRLDREVTRFGGRVDKHMGDAVMAVWGAEATREDEVERAVLAGLALQAALSEFRAATGHAVTMRVGINTGPALVGAVGTNAELTAMGDTVNVASRLEHAAPVGAVLVSHDTYRHVRGVFDVEPQPLLEVRGKSEPLVTYVVRQAKPRAFRIPSRGVEGVETATIGRDVERATLQAEYEAAASGGARLVLVVGEAGVGKSRLLFELESWLELRPEAVWFLQGRALATRQGVALGLLRDVLAQRFNVLDSDTPAQVAAKLRGGFAGVLATAEAELVARWLGYDVAAPAAVGGDALDRAARAHLVRWLGQLATDEPAVLLLEDLHWADAASLAVIAELIARLPEARLLVVGLTRPDLAEREPAWLNGTIPAARIDLRPLDAGTTARLVREVLRPAGEVPDALVQLIVQRSDGNAFFVEELVKMLTEQGVIHTGGADGAWSIEAAAFDAAAVPATLTGVLQARLDDLASEERSALQRAAVIGRVFWDSAVEAMGHAAAGAALDAAKARELVYRRDPSTFTDAGEFIFKHALLRDVTYETVLLRDRSRLHGLAAAWLTAQAGERLGEYLATIAEHHRQAGELDAAATCFHRAARAALDRGFAGPARSSIEHAVELWEQAGTGVPARAFADLGDACRRLGDLDAAEDALGIALERVSDPLVAVEALRLASRVAYDRGDHAKERELIERASTLADPDDLLMQGKVLGAMASWELRHGDLDEAHRLAERARAAAAQIGAMVEQIDAHSVLGGVAASRDELDEALGHVRACLELAQGSGDLAAEAMAHGNLGVTLHLKGDATGDAASYRAAIGHYELEQSARRDLGDRLATCMSLLNQAQARLRLGENAAAHATVTEALALAWSLGALRQVLFPLLLEADLCLTVGAVDRGLPLLGVVQAHPEADRNDHQEIERILSRAELDPAVVAAGLAAGAQLDLADVVAELLAGDEGAPG